MRRAPAQRDELPQGDELPGPRALSFNQSLGAREEQMALAARRDSKLYGSLFKATARIAHQPLSASLNDDIDGHE